MVPKPLFASITAEPQAVRLLERCEKEVAREVQEKADHVAEGFGRKREDELR